MKLMHRPYKISLETDPTSFNIYLEVRKFNILLNKVSMYHHVNISNQLGLDFSRLTLMNKYYVL